MEFTLTQDRSAMGSALSEQKNTLAKNSDCSKTFWFSVCFTGYMDMYGDLKTVADYLNAHEGWFCRCAQPMTVEPLHENGYILNIGRFASLGYEVEPKIAVVIDPPQDNLYMMRTVPVPNYEPPGYEVQYKSLMELAEIPTDEITKPSRKKLFSPKLTPPDIITRVSWQLDLAVTVEFPKFIEKLPTALVQNTGDRLLSQIVRQISPRLSYKVQQDFHLARDLPIPSKSGRGLSKMAKQCQVTAQDYDDEVLSSSQPERSTNSNHAA